MTSFKHLGADLFAPSPALETEQLRLRKRNANYHSVCRVEGCGKERCEEADIALCKDHYLEYMRNKHDRYRKAKMSAAAVEPPRNLTRAERRLTAFVVAHPDVVFVWHQGEDGSFVGLSSITPDGIRIGVQTQEVQT